MITGTRLCVPLDGTLREAMLNTENTEFTDAAEVGAVIFFKGWIQKCSVKREQPISELLSVEACRNKRPLAFLPQSPGGIGSCRPFADERTTEAWSVTGQVSDRCPPGTRDENSCPSEGSCRLVIYRYVASLLSYVIAREEKMEFNCDIRRDVYVTTHDYPRLPVTTCDNLVQPVTTCDNLRLSVTTCDYLRQLATTCDYLQLSATTRDYLRQLAATYDYPRLPAITCDYLRQLAITCDYPQCNTGPRDIWGYRCSPFGVRHTISSDEFGSSSDRSRERVWSTHVHSSVPDARMSSGEVWCRSRSAAILVLDLTARGAGVIRCRYRILGVLVLLDVVIGGWGGAKCGMCGAKYGAYGAGCGAFGAGCGAFGAGCSVSGADYGTCGADYGTHGNDCGLYGADSSAMRAKGRASSRPKMECIPRRCLCHYCEKKFSKSRDSHRREVNCIRNVEQYKSQFGQRSDNLKRDLKSVLAGTPLTEVKSPADTGSLNKINDEASSCPLAMKNNTPLCSPLIRTRRFVLREYVYVDALGRLDVYFTFPAPLHSITCGFMGITGSLLRCSSQPYTIPVFRLGFLTRNPSQPTVTNQTKTLVARASRCHSESRCANIKVNAVPFRICTLICSNLLLSWVNENCNNIGGTTECKDEGELRENLPGIEPATPECNGGRNGRFPRKPAYQRHHLARFPLARNPGATQLGIESDSPWWEASGLTAQLLRPQMVLEIKAYVRVLVGVCDAACEIVTDGCGCSDRQENIPASRMIMPVLAHRDLGSEIAAVNALLFRSGGHICFIGIGYAKSKHRIKGLESDLTIAILVLSVILSPMLDVIHGHGYRVTVMVQVQGYLGPTWWLGNVITWWLVGSRPSNPLSYNIRNFNVPMRQNRHNHSTPAITSKPTKYRLIKKKECQTVANPLVFDLFTSKSEFCSILKQTCDTNRAGMLGENLICPLWDILYMLQVSPAACRAAGEHGCTICQAGRQVRPAGVADARPTDRGGYSRRGRRRLILRTAAGSCPGSRSWSAWHRPPPAISNRRPVTARRAQQHFSSTATPPTPPTHCTITSVTLRTPYTCVGGEHGQVVSHLFQTPGHFTSSLDGQAEPGSFTYIPGDITLETCKIRSELLYEFFRRQDIRQVFVLLRMDQWRVANCCKLMLHAPRMYSSKQAPAYLATVHHTSLDWTTQLSGLTQARLQPQQESLVQLSSEQSTVSLLASHQSDPNSIPGRVTPDFRMWESCWMMPSVGGFSWGPLISPTISFRRCSILTSITFIGSQDLDVKSRPHFAPLFDKCAFSSRQQPMAIDKLLLGAYSIEIYHLTISWLRVNGMTTVQSFAAIYTLIVSAFKDELGIYLAHFGATLEHKAQPTFTQSTQLCKCTGNVHKSSIVLRKVHCPMYQISLVKTTKQVCNSSSSHRELQSHMTTKWHHCRPTCRYAAVRQSAPGNLLVTSGSPRQQGIFRRMQ
ncbi:hypothetical protein PR048_028853 [Dryococelus australis]|uniref:Uncharacterized protein n=1 Tax=Dryococelus australis TaxID=614101 RepID=A0ABQ9GBP6_9NEOP|nr:hypothetical protein PR048_028853 [Dryococelus australis]